MAKIISKNLKVYGNTFSGANGAIITGFPPDNNNSVSFKINTKTAGRTGNDGSKDFKITVPLKYLSIFSRDVEMPLINCEINLILTWSALHKICENTDFYLPIIVDSVLIRENTH